MPSIYTPPGVNVSELVSPSIVPYLATPAVPCLIGVGQGYQTRTDQIRLEATTATPLPGIAADSTLVSVVSVKDAIDPTKGNVDGSGYTLTTDYTISTTNKTVTRVAAGAIATGTIVNVTYQYLPAGYFEPIRLDDMGAIERRFGSAYNTAGTAIESVLSFAAGVALENGAGSVVLQPLFVYATPGDPITDKVQPTTTQAAAVTSWSDTLNFLRDYEEVNLLTPVIGQSAANVSDAAQLGVLQKVQDHMQFMAAQNQYIMGVFGEDSSTNVANATQTTLRNHATILAGRYGGKLAEQMVLLDSAKFARALPTTGQRIIVGGQYMAAALAGMITGNDVSQTLTRKQISGFTEALESRNLFEKNENASNGLLVVEQKGLALLVRHAITLDTTASARREISVVRAKHRMIESVRDTLDRQIIGKIVADETAQTIVSTAVVGVLEELRQVRNIVDYSGVAARMTSLDPTAMEVRFSYRPSFPLNYISVVFSIDLTTGDFIDETTGSTIARV